MQPPRPAGSPQRPGGLGFWAGFWVDLPFSVRGGGAGAATVPARAHSRPPWYCILQHLARQSKRKWRLGHLPRRQSPTHSQELDTLSPEARLGQACLNPLFSTHDTRPTLPRPASAARSPRARRPDRPAPAARSAAKPACGRVFRAILPVRGGYCPPGWGFCPRFCPSLMC